MKTSFFYLIYSIALLFSAASVAAQENAETIYQQALEAFDAGEYQAALTALDHVIELQADYPDAHTYRAVCKEVLGELEAALQDYSIALAQYPEDPLARHYRALAYYDNYRLEEAIADYDTILQVNPTDDLAFYSRGLCYLDLGEYRSAEDDFNKAITMEPQDSTYLFAMGWLYLNEMRYEDAIQAFDETIRMAPNYGDAYVYKAESYELLGDTTSAINAYLKAIELQAQDTYYALYSLGGIAMDEFRYEEAALFLDRSIELNPNFPEVFCSRGWLGFLTGDLEAAEVDLKKSVELSPEFGLALNNLGVVKKAQQDLFAAKMYFLRAVQTDDPDTYFAHYNLADIQSDEGAYQEAIKNFTLAIEGYPLYTEALNGRGWTYYLVGSYDKALEDFNRALEITPTDALIVNNRGVVYEEMGEIDAALKNYEEAIAIQQPGIYFPYYNRANILVDRGAYKPAIEDYSKALEMSPENADILNNRGWAFFLIGQFESARNDFQKALDLNPNHPNAGANLIMVEEELKNKKRRKKN